MIHFNIRNVPEVSGAYRPPPNIVLVCLGESTKIPQALGPLTGSILYEEGYFVYGSLAEPVLAVDEVDVPENTPMLVLEAAVEDGVQPGYAELSIPAENMWRLQVFLPERHVHYSDVARFSRMAAICIRMLTQFDSTMSSRAAERRKRRRTQAIQ